MESNTGREDAGQDVTRAADGNWSFPSPWPWRHGNAYGVEEAYGWLWTVAKGTRRGPDDTAFELVAHLYSSRTRGTRTQASVPFLFNYEADEGGSVLRLFQFIPISFGGGLNDGEPASSGDDVLNMQSSATESPAMQRPHLDLDAASSPHEPSSSEAQR